MRLGMLSGLRNLLISARMAMFRKVFKMDLHPSVKMSLSAQMDMTFPAGIHIGKNSYLAFGCKVLSHDYTRGLYLHTRIGENCFIGGRAMVMPGITIGDNCIVGAGSVVTRDVPAGTIVAGNPAQVVKEGITLKPFGRYLEADDNEERLRQTDPEVGRLSSKQRDKRLAEETGKDG